jgi:hypothetical protein
MAITAKRTYETAGPVNRLQGKLAAGATYYDGQLVVLNGGLFTIPTDTAGRIPLGILTGFGMEPGTGRKVVAGGDNSQDAEVIRGLVWIPFSGAAQADVGALFYFADNGDVTKTAGSKNRPVLCVGFKAGSVLLDLNNPVFA